MRRTAKPSSRAVVLVRSCGMSLRVNHSDTWVVTMLPMRRMAKPSSLGGVMAQRDCGMSLQANHSKLSPIINDAVTSITYAPDGKTVLMGSDEHTVPVVCQGFWFFRDFDAPDKPFE